MLTIHEHKTCNECGQILGYQSTDHLTGLLDRWAWNEIAPAMLKDHRSVVLLALDLDRFRSVNNRYGHAAGDAVLKQVAQILTANVRTGDLVARYGGHAGDEFLILLPDADHDLGLTIAHRIRTSINRLTVMFRAGDTMIPIEDCQTSIGMTVIDNHSAQVSIDDLVARADKALFAAKNNGRNRVVVDPQSITAHRIFKEE